MIEACPKRNIISQWLTWHFCEVPKEILKGLRNFLIFNFHYFSIPLLARTLFSHWRRYIEYYPRGFDIKGWLRAFSGNMISRTLGAIVRTVTILVGLVVEFFILIGGVIIILVWLFLPILIIFGFYLGLRLLI